MGTGHFCRSLHVAMQVGLSLQPDPGVYQVVWRKVSEDIALGWTIFPADCLHFKRYYCRFLNE